MTELTKPTTPARVASASRNGKKQSHRKKQVADPDPLGEFAVEVQVAMDQVTFDLQTKVLKSWNDAKLREQTRGLIISNVQATEQARALRRQLLTRAQVAERDAKRDEIILGRLHELVDYAAGLVPLDQQQAARKAAGEWLAGLRGRIADELEAMR